MLRLQTSSGDAQTTESPNTAKSAMENILRSKKSPVWRRSVGLASAMTDYCGQKTNVGFDRTLSSWSLDNSLLSLVSEKDVFQSTSDEYSVLTLEL